MVKETLRSKTKVIYLLITSITIGINWLVFIWAISIDHMLDASLGYYINPLFNVILGMIFLNEKLRKLQWFAVTLASIGCNCSTGCFWFCSHYCDSACFQLWYLRTIA